MNRIIRLTPGLILLCAAAVLVTPAALQAHEGHGPHGAPINSFSARISPSAAALALSGDPPPVVARYEVSVIAAPNITNTGATPAAPVLWHFFRSAQQVAVLKGSIDEVWRRDPQGRLSFERVFHAEKRVVDYSTGELATLGIRAPWQALASFVDPEVLATLKLVSRTGAGVDEQVHLAGVVGNETLRVDWMPAWQLPARLLRTGPQGAMTDIRLMAHAATPPSDWPLPGSRSSGYLRLDAADFGDMAYEAVVRKSEALDVRLGWRTAHQHD